MKGTSHQYTLYCAIEQSHICMSCTVNNTHSHPHQWSVCICVDEIIMRRGLFLAPSQSSGAGVNNRLLQQQTLSFNRSLPRLSFTWPLLWCSTFSDWCDLAFLIHSRLSCTHHSSSLSTAQTSVSVSPSIFVNIPRLWCICRSSHFSIYPLADPLGLSSLYQCPMLSLHSALIYSPASLSSLSSSYSHNFSFLKSSHLFLPMLNFISPSYQI